MKIRTFLTLFLAWMALGLSAQNSYDILAFGAKGDGVTDDAVAIQKAIDRCSAEGGGKVLFPRNHVFLSGPVELKSHVEIHLEATAIWKANPDEKIYHLSAFGENRGEGTHEPVGDKYRNHSADEPPFLPRKSMRQHSPKSFSILSWAVLTSKATRSPPTRLGPPAGNFSFSLPVLGVMVGSLGVAGFGLTISLPSVLSLPVLGVTAGS